jgi:hypothetical protein
MHRMSHRSKPHCAVRCCSEAEYTEYRALRVFVGTWNVNGKWPKEELAPWLCDGAEADGGANMPDLYVVG